MKLTVLTALLVAFSVVGACYYLHTAQDDAFISFRYAKHFVEHGSLSFNGSGYDRAEGYSNFTWVLLIALGYAVGVAPFVSAKVFGLMSFVAALLGTARLVDRLLRRRSGFRLFAVMALGSSACFASWSVQGLETVFIAALVVWSAVSVVEILPGSGQDSPKGSAVRCGLVLGVLAISRPEAPLFGVVALAAVATTLKRSPIRRQVLLPLAALFGVAVFAQLAFRVGYYGRITVNTYYAKVVGDRLIARGFMYLLDYAEAKGLLFTALWGAIVPVALVRIMRRNWLDALAPLVVTALLAAYAAYIVFVGGDWMRGFRFCMHVLPLAVALGTWAMSSVLDSLGRVLREPSRHLVMAAMVGATLWSNLVTERAFKFGAQGAVADTASGLGFFAIWSVPPGPHFRVARWLKHRLPNQSLVALSEAGIIPFESDLPVLDDVGLNDRTVADLLYRRASPATVARYVLSQRPVAIVMLGNANPDALDGAFSARLPNDVAMQAMWEFTTSYRLSTFVPLEPAVRPDVLGFGVFVHSGTPLRALRGTLLAQPNPVPLGGSTLGETTLSWAGWDGENAAVFVSDNGSKETLVSPGDEGTAFFPWVQTGHSYVFSVYGRAHRLLGWLEVTRGSGRGPRLPTIVDDTGSVAAPPPLASRLAAADPSVAAQFVDGFYGVENGSWRWTAKTFTVELGVPSGAKEVGATLHLDFTLTDAELKEGPPVHFSAKVGDTPIAARTFGQSGDSEFVGDVPNTMLGEPRIRVQFSLDRSYSPGGGDTRELGVIMHSIALEAK